jgi:Co/Zn/Cd efflux system component
MVNGVIPKPETMGLIAGLALAANGLCLFILFRHRRDDINMRSTWICSRNDIIANVGVIGASILVALTHSNFPDTVVGISIAGLFLCSAFGVISESIKELKLANCP